MNGNGTEVNPLRGFEIVTDVGGARWFGKVKGEEAAEIVLEPVWELAPRQFFPVPVQQGMKWASASVGGAFLVYDRPSQIAARIRWASRISLDSFSDDDRKFFREMLRQSEQNTRAARAGLAL